MKKVITIFAFSAVFIVGVFFCICKQGMFEDEVVTYGLGNSHNASWIYNVKGLTDNDMRGEILHQSEIRSYLTVDEGQRFDIGSAYLNQTNDVHPPLYYILLHIVSSFFVGSFSKWIGLSLNLVIWTATFSILYISAMKVTCDRRFALLSVIIYGVSAGGLSSLLFIRMYILLSFFAVLLVYNIICLQTASKFSHLRYLFVVLTVLGGLMTQYEFLYFSSVFCFFYAIFLLVKKQTKKSLLFFGSFISGVFLFFISFPYFFSQFKSGANGGVVSGGAILQRILNLGGWQILFYKGIKTLSWENPLMLPLFILLSIAVMVGYSVFMIKNHRLIIDLSLYLFVSAATAFAVIIIGNPIVSNRYYYIMLPVFAMLIGIGLFRIVTYFEKHIVIPIKFKKVAVNSSILLLSATSFVLLLFIKPGYIYSDYGDYIKKAKEFSSAPTLYIADDTCPQIHDETLQFLIYSDDCLVASTAKSQNADRGYIEAYLTDHPENDKVLVYMDTNITDIDAEIQVLIDSYDCHECQGLFATPRTNVYLFTR